MKAMKGLRLWLPGSHQSDNMAELPGLRRCRGCKA